MLRHALLPAALFAAAASCATNPATGKRMISLISESQEIQIGKQEAEKTKQSIGLVNDPKLQAYVSGIGMEMARRSERPNLPWEFHVVEDDAINAFALPGGFIFVTRGILTHMNSEAELASVLGHEIGHVTARHSVSQISKAQLAQLGLVAGSVLSSDFAQYAGAASAGLSVLFLKFGRDAENEADALGFRYALADGYDVRDMTRMFRTLDRVSDAAGGGRLPEWQSTHPNPDNRVANTERRIAQVGRNLDSLASRRDEFLRVTDGLVFGKNPRQGFFRDGTFFHPDLRFQFAFPRDWRTQNGATAVVAQSPQQDAIMQFTFAQGTPQQAAQQFFGQQGLTASDVRQESIGGQPSTSGAFQATLQDGTVVRGVASFISYGGTTYAFMGYTPTARFGANGPAMRQATQSFRPLTDPAILNVQPAKVQLVKLPRTMSLSTFNQQYPSSIPIEQLALINGVDGPAATFRAGTFLKRVTGGTLR